MTHYTTIEQSKKLVELGLNPDTADMSYTYDFNDSRYVITTTPAKNWIVPKYAESTKIKQVLPCWSLGALLEVMLKEDVKPFEDSNPFIDYGDKKHRCVYLNADWGSSHQTIGYTPVEAAYNMICWLLENGYIKKENKMEDYKKKYEDARNRAKCYKGLKPEMEIVFPELKESEDEKMRTMAIKAVYAPEAQSCIKSWGINPDDVIAWLEKQGEQKPEIEGTFVNVDDVRENFVKEVYRVLANDTTNDRANDIIYYFDSLPTIYLHTNKPLPSDDDDFDMDDILKNHAWSEEDEKILGKCIDAASGYYSPEDKQSIKYWLRHLKGRIVLQQQPKQEWNEEDEETLNNILNDLLQSVIPDDEDIQWLKSLKERYIWKPSNEQMEALNDAVRLYKSTHFDSHHYKIESLYEDLKKLKEE